MSIIFEILEHLSNTKIHYKGVRVNLFGIPDFESYNKRSILSTVSRLHRRGLVSKADKNWAITGNGRTYLRNHKVLPKFSSPFKSSSPRNLLLMFDIPETRKKERHWLRKHLIEFNYFMVQKSVWVGPSPLPEKFSKYIKEIKLDQYIKKFKLAKNYQIPRKF